MSQSRFLQEEYSKKYRKAANNAAINLAITDLVAARNVRHADGGKRLIKSTNSYKNVIASLQSVGVDITYDALMMLPMLRRDCLGWLPSEGSLQTCWRGMESKEVLTRMTMNMDGKIY
jgi:hypothetical protein